MNAETKREDLLSFKKQKGNKRSDQVFEIQHFF
jgi:hypothetical protein